MSSLRSGSETGRPVRAYSPEARVVARAQVALAWLRRNPVVAPLVGASKTSQIDHAVASLTIELTRATAPTPNMARLWS